MQLQRSTEKHFRGANLRDVILGSQDGLVNVLGLVLGVATATNNALVIIVAALAATFAETISMAAVAYTSTKAEKDFYLSEQHRENTEIDTVPETERKEIREIYYRKGFRGKILKEIVNKITSNRKIWLQTMMLEELQLPLKDHLNPLSSFSIVFIATLVGSLIPLSPFLFLPVRDAVIATVLVSCMILFALGVLKAKMTVGSMWRSGLESLMIGIAAAVLGYLVGYSLGRIFGMSVTTL